MKRIIMAAMIVSLAACGGDKDDVATEQQQEWEAAKASLVYSFPDNGQQQVPTSSPVVLRFSSPVVVTNAALMDLIELRDDEGGLVEWDRVEEADGGQSLLLYPESKLEPMTDYQLSIAKIDLEKGDAEARNLSFSTRAAYEGPKSQVAEEEFRILRTIPNGDDFEVLEFTTFRVQFSQPLDRSTVIYGDGADATVQLAGPEGVVDAHVLVSGPYLTIDPKEDLQADADYKLTFTTGLTSIYGDNMPGGGFGNPGGTIASELEVTAKATGPRGNMVQIIADTAGQKSPLTGKQINEVPMASVLLGEDTATQASGIVTAELAFVPDFPDATPLRVKRGSLIEGTSIEVLIGGEVPAGFESGTVRMDFLSDATGYLLPNPYSDADDAPRQVRLWMDVAVSTETPRANGAITQDLLHIELVGTSVVDAEKKRMIINAVGVVEPNVLGADRATGLLSFYMEEALDQDTPPEVTEPYTDFYLQSVTTENVKGGQSAYAAGDPIVLNFSAPVDPRSIEKDITLITDGIEVPINKITTDGASFIIHLAELIIPRKSEDSASQQYNILIPEGVNGIHGQNTGAIDLAFTIGNSPNNKVVMTAWSGRDDANSLVDYSPLVLATYPGYPCVLSDSGRDLSLKKAGRCAGGFLGDPLEIADKEADDIIPILGVSPTAPIVVVFSKPIDSESVRLGETFIVEEIDESGSNVSNVDGELFVDGNVIRFIPENVWKNNAFYKYTVVSSGYIKNYTASGATNKIERDPSFDSNVNCKAGSSDPAICDVQGFPVQTQFMPDGNMGYPSEPSPSVHPVTGDVSYKIVENWQNWVYRRSGNNPDAGGPPMEQYFYVDEGKENSVVQVLQSYPKSDVNANLWHDIDTIVPLTETATHIEFSVSSDEPQGYINSPHSHSNEDIALADPGGLLPNYNFIKLLTLLDSEKVDTAISDVGIGCGYDSTNTFMNTSRLACPENKFIAVNTALITEVTNNYVEGKGVEVRIWPSVVTGASVFAVAPTTLVPYEGLQDLSYGPVKAATGPQYMRMRHDNMSPISAWIDSGDNGAVINATINMYIDAPYFGQYGTGISSSSSNMNSYPVEVDLSGEVTFLDDGRMLVQQSNVEDIVFPMELRSSNGVLMGRNSMVIPKSGINMSFISNSIK